MDVKNDPTGNDGVHCDWSYTPAGGDPVAMGKTKANSLCEDPGYELTKITHAWDTPGTYTVECTMNNCHILADDPDSLVCNITVNVVNPPPPPLYVEFTYDKNGNRKTMKDQRGTTTYDWDRLGRLTKVTEPDAKWIAYEYDWNSNRTKMTDHFSGVTTYEYNDRGLLWKLTDRNSGVTEYEYWENGLLKKMTYPNGAYAEYGV